MWAAKCTSTSQSGTAKHENFSASQSSSPIPIRDPIKSQTLGSNDEHMLSGVEAKKLHHSPKSNFNTYFKVISCGLNGLC